MGVFCALMLFFAGFCFIVNLAPNISIPSPKPPADNGYDELLQIARAAVKLKHQGPRDSDVPLTPAQERAETAACTAEAAPLILRLRTLLPRPIVAPPVRTIKQSLVFPASFIRSLARVISTCADNELQNGKPAESMEIRLDGLEIMTAATGGQSYIGLLTLIACQAIIEAGFEQDIEKLNAAQLAHLAERLERIRSRREPFSDIVQEEGYEQTAEFQELLSKSGKDGLRSYQSARNLVADDEDKSLTWSERRQLLRYLLSSKGKMLNENLDYFTQISTELRKPKGSRKQVNMPDNLLANYEVGMLGLGSQGENRSESEFEILRTEVALKRYQLAKGSYPTDLTRLVPVYLTSPPLDPTGNTGTELLHYHLVSKVRYLLYGDDPNRQDEGRIATPQNSPQTGDIVAGRHSRPKTKR